MSDKLLTSMQEVQQELSNLRNEANYYLFEARRNAFYEQIQELKAIQAMVMAKEQEFYNKLNITDQSYEGMIARIKEIERKYDVLLPNGAIMNEIRNTFIFSNKHMSDDNLRIELEKTLNQFLTQELSNKELNQEFLNALNESNYTDTILYFLEKRLREKGIRVFTHGRGEKEQITNIGLGKLIVSVVHRKRDIKKIAEGQGGPIIKISEDGLSRISPAFKKRLLEYFEKNMTKNKTVVELYTLEQYRNIIDGIISMHLNQTLWVPQKNYDLRRNLSSTQGYLGEIRATLILQELTGNRVETEGTGALKDAIKGWEIPIDLVCRANGFQIKNYTLNNNQVTFSNSLSSVAWVDDRMQLQGEVREVLMGLFGVYQFNQPLVTNKKANNLEEFRQLYSQVNPIFQQLTPFYNSRIPYMVKLLDYFSVEGHNIFNDRQLYFNTFFWINNRLVPSSWILEKLINTIGFTLDNSVIKSSYTLEEPDKYSIRYQKLANAVRKNSSAYTNLDAAKKARVSYNITFDLSEFAHI